MQQPDAGMAGSQDVTIFHDPGLEWGRPSLIGDLLTVPATPGMHQLENQATTVLAWLVDRSPAFAGALVRLFVGVEVEAGELVAARTQVSLPKPGGGALRPDLSVCVGDRRLQLLVEVKVNAQLSTYAELEDIDQVAAYRKLWSPLRGAEAATRAVGSLTRAGDRTTVDLQQLVARGVSWRELRDVTGTLLAAGALEPPVAGVAASLVEAIDTQIAPRPLTDAELLAFYQQHHRQLDETCRRIRNGLQDTGDPKRIKGTAYDGWRIPVGQVDGKPMYLRLYISPANSRLNLKGAPDALIAGPERDANGTLATAERLAADAASFPLAKDVSGGTMHRRLWPLRRLDPEVAAEDIMAALAQAGFAIRLPPSTRPTLPQGDFTVVMSRELIGKPLQDIEFCANPGHHKQEHLTEQSVHVHATRHDDDVWISGTIGLPIDLAYALGAARAARVPATVIHDGGGLEFVAGAGHPLLPYVSQPDPRFPGHDPNRWQYAQQVLAEARWSYFQDWQPPADWIAPDPVWPPTP